VTAREPIVVVAAVAERDGRYLVTRRLAGTHLAGLWEFPGGKCEPGETHAQCLDREMREELDVGVHVGPELLTARHDYGTKIVELHFFTCTVHGEPQPVLGQEIRWVSPRELAALKFPAADAELIELLTESV
jgi:mutator protein MutT